MAAGACRDAGCAGVVGAVASVARAAGVGGVPLPANDRPQTNTEDQPGNVELRGIISSLSGADTPDCDRALFALADPAHPDHEMAARHILSGRIGWDESDAWFAHPYCLAILRQALDDRTPTGATYRIEG